MSVIAPFASAGDFKLGEDPVTAIMKWRPTTPDPEVAPFVRDTRPDEHALTYRRLREPKVDRPKLKTKDELKTMTGDLDAKAVALRARTGGVTSTGASSTRDLQAAAAAIRRRAAQDFAGAGK